MFQGWHSRGINKLHSSLNLLFCMPINVSFKKTTIAWHATICFLWQGAKVGRLMIYIKDNVWFQWRMVYVLTRGFLWCLLTELWSNREMNSKITLEWAHKQFVNRVHALFCFLHDNAHSLTLFSLYGTYYTFFSTHHFTFKFQNINGLLHIDIMACHIFYMEPSPNRYWFRIVYNQGTRSMGTF